MSRDPQPQPITLSMIFGTLISIARVLDRIATAMEAPQPQKPSQE